jgi:SGNH domain (fused to AT3 domains)
MAPAIDLAARIQGKRGLFAGRGGCPPLINYTIPSSQLWKRRTCQEGNNAVLNLVEQKRIPLVFLIGRWPREVLGTENGREGPFYDPSASHSVQDRSAIVASALGSTISALVKVGARPVLVTGVPEPGYDVPISLARAALAKTVAQVNPTRAAVYARQAPALNLLQKAAAKWNISIVDTLAYFCDDEICRVQHGGVSLYRDEDHITQSTALSLAYLFEDSFSKR